MFMETMRTPLRDRLPPPVALAAMLALIVALNALLALYVWAPVGEPARILVPITETLALVWLVTLAARVSRRGPRRIALLGIGAPLGIFAGVAVAEAFFRFYFARSFAPRTDVGMIRGALFLFLGEQSELAHALAPVTIALLFVSLVALGWVLATGLATLVTRIPRSIPALTVITVLAVPLMLAVGLPASLARRATVAWVEEDRLVLREVAGASRTSGESEVLPGGPVAAEAPDEDANDEQFAFPGIRDRDIYLLAVEAYGYASVARPELSRQIDPYRDAYEDALAKHGYKVVTGYLESPVAGGYSWLAEATLLTGQWIDSQEKFRQLYEAKPATLSGMLHGGGYYTYTVRPGTVHGEWPEGWELFRFEESLIAHGDGFGFRGPWFSYVPVTDQYAIWTGEQRIRELVAPGGAAESRPLLAYFQLVSSHTPFNRIPPFIEDWRALGDGSIYNRRSDEIRLFDNTWTGGTELEEGWVAAIGYVFTVLTDYVAEVMNHNRDAIIIVYGDHQPQRPIRSPRAALSVPVHVASRDAAVLERFAEYAFHPGMVGDEPPPHARMDAFFPMMADIASRPPLSDTAVWSDPARSR